MERAGGQVGSELSCVPVVGRPHSYTYLLLRSVAVRAVSHIILVEAVKNTKEVAFVVTVRRGACVRLCRAAYAQTSANCKPLSSSLAAKKGTSITYRPSRPHVWPCCRKLSNCLRMVASACLLPSSSMTKSPLSIDTRRPLFSFQRCCSVGMSLNGDTTCSKPCWT